MSDNNFSHIEESHVGHVNLLEKLQKEWKAGPCRVCTEPVTKEERGHSSTFLGGRVHKKCETPGFPNSGS